MNIYKNAYLNKCKNGQFHKEYIAILDGILEEKHGTINAPISRKEGSIIERCIDKNGINAVSHYSLINEVNNLSIVKFVLETGRTHQIRLHSKYIEHPILGDTLYGKSSTLINRQALHCHKLTFVHPIQKKKIEFISAIPEDMEKISTKKSYIGPR